MLQDGSRAGVYAAVVIATPLEQTELTFEGLALPPIPRRVYQDTVTTIVRGRLRASFFNMTDLPEGTLELLCWALHTKLAFQITNAE